MATIELHFNGEQSAELEKLVSMYVSDTRKVELRELVNAHIDKLELAEIERKMVTVSVKTNPALVKVFDAIIKVANSSKKEFEEAKVIKIRENLLNTTLAYLNLHTTDIKALAQYLGTFEISVMQYLNSKGSLTEKQERALKASLLNLGASEGIGKQVVDNFFSKPMEYKA
jgi:hypothetical protein